MMNILELKEIKKVFHNSEDLNILDGINISIAAGDSISIVGKSGSGKSTLLHISGGLEKPTSGEVLLGDKNFYSLSDQIQSKTRNLRFGFIFQSNYLLEDFTSYENVLLPSLISGKKSIKRTNELLERVGLMDRKNHKPSQLSGGERQRIAICRALINQPDIIFADEPTGSLDEENAGLIENLLLNVVKEENRALFLVTHNKDFANKCDKRFILKNKHLMLLEDTIE